LDWGGGDVFLFGERTDDGIGEAEVMEGSQIGFFLWLRDGARSRRCAMIAIDTPRDLGCRYGK
jgi:hypothetical protein